MGSCPTQQNISRFGFLVGQCSRMCHYAVISDEAFHTAKGLIEDLTLRVKTISEETTNKTNNATTDAGVNSSQFIKDPHPVRSKGNVKQPQVKTWLCKYCRRPKHTIRNCPLKRMAEAGAGDSHFTQQEYNFESIGAGESSFHVETQESVLLPKRSKHNL
ncbi:unnamed protein product [Linum trigynum]|uniref:Uncharacterized protein n=1 Tax=Linum trigynum TaxID=586398 RepID=A0AAV2GQU3_9ROSI